MLFNQHSHGRSPRADFDPQHLDQFRSDLRAAIDAAGPTGTLMRVGHSTGGMTIMALAAQRAGTDLLSPRVPVLDG